MINLFKSPNLGKTILSSTQFSKVIKNNASWYSKMTGDIYEKKNINEGELIHESQ
ncbi:MAG: hypothetical protein ACI846_000116 [Pseudoalteromonas distincta]|jgi:hypothetical protein